MVGWLVDYLISWFGLVELFGLLVCWLVRLVGLVWWFVCLFVCWLVGWFWLVGWLVVWLVDLLMRLCSYKHTCMYTIRLCDMCHYASRKHEMKHDNYVSSNLYFCRNVPNYVNAILLF